MARALRAVRWGAATSIANNPDKQKLFEKKDQLEQQVDQLNYNKAVIQPDQYKKQLTALLLELAKTQEELEK